MYVVSLTGNTKLTWFVALCALTTLNFEPFISMMKSLIDDDEEETWYYFLMFTIALINIRCTSFCLEKCWNYQEQQAAQESQNTDMYKERKQPGTIHEQGSGNQTKEGKEAVGYSFIDFLSYVFYLPLYFTGPILTYNLYKEQMNSPIPENPRPHLKLQTLHLFRICFWAMFNEFLLHFLYFNALQHNTAVLRSVSLFSLAGLGYSHGQFFMVKYLVMFGLPGTIAKFDYLNPPDPPNCISYIYLYSDMWKCFDKGLYSFLKRYIYVPCGGSQAGFLRQTLGSVLCFTYIFYWHGAEYYILLWILVNYMGIILEKIGSAICSIPYISHIEKNVLSAAMVQRIHSFFSIPIFLTSCFSMFCFFGGKTV
ncbi:protein-cysteine N-palmitoyltransferase HHAT-like, partial [Ruditapes philippinarum]|uniref:protein-cysteine N-palmitoyltransferase HHAT-like n=1 Tax=Ruditapes philippinarum TaxID=129788 RepID=UPI00295B29E4